MLQYSLLEEVSSLMLSLGKINFLFMLISLIYIILIFLLSDSPVVSNISHFNPYSLLHIPLYGILTLLLYLSFRPHIFYKNVEGEVKIRFFYYLHIPISVIVAILDEIHQLYIPFREASIFDVLLDITGIGLASIILNCSSKKFNITQKASSRHSP